jgi:hypothetical protein
MKISVFLIVKWCLMVHVKGAPHFFNQTEIQSSLILSSNHGAEAFYSQNLERRYYILSNS